MFDFFTKLKKIKGDEEVFKRLYEKKILLDRNEIWEKVLSVIYALATFSKYWFDQEENKQKERNVTSKCVPFEHNRVILSSTEENPHGYINASYVKFPKINRQYIMTSEIAFNEIRYYWQMVYEQRVPGIVLLKSLSEIWSINTIYPEKIDAQLTFGDFTVRCKNLEIHRHYIVRDMELISLKSKEVHKFRHYHYWFWSDLETANLDPMLDFHKVLKENETLNSPIPTVSTSFFNRKQSEITPSKAAIIQCYSGNPRSTVFIVMDVLVEMIEKGIKGHYSIEYMLIKLQKQRMFELKSFKDISFIYDYMIRFILQRHPELHALKSHLEHHAITIPRVDPEITEDAERFIKTDRWLVNEKERDRFIGMRQAAARFQETGLASVVCL
ncbi:hypothetical protein GCK72_000659 [Caenorhabditis remanei]|uniref:Tyrosine-protein phosphatase domain-containing protein n=1 Tax=Caenorhabditis remanei TaxID=31234 RepID=A0A6A5HQA0_CAERE|nr:hypothetical protein GCK72_000659 [Caenorhabditis remanei]KAF1768846.1 hypothetical protein GCK72_000659 [Caenorhabditis remanei]